MPTPSEPVLVNSTQYQDIAASATAVALGPGGGAIGDYLSHFTVVPSSLSPGAITMTDGNGSAINLFAGGASSLLTLHPFPVPWGANSTAGAWKITTGAGLTVKAFGRFT